MANQYSNPDLASRFWSKVSVLGPDECHPWTGPVDGGGYGQFWLRGGMRHAHRIAWIMKNGYIPKGEGYHGICVCHTCDNRLCQNTRHMFLGTHKQNMEDRSRKGRCAIPDVRGIKNPGAKLTEEKVREIRKASGTCIQIGKAFGVSPMTVSRVKTRRLWNHVSDERKAA